MAGKVSWEKIGKLAVIRFAQFTVDPDFISDLCTAFDDIESDQDIRVVLLAGAKGKIFFAGYDISLLTGSESEEVLIAKTLEVQRMMDRLEACSCPVIAVVDGYALGGGCEMALASDLVYASHRAVFGTPEVKIGIIAAAGGVMRLPQQVTKHQAMEMLLTAKMYSAEQAREMGIVNAVFHHDELWEKVLDIANSIAGHAPIAIKASKACVLASLNAMNQELEMLSARACAECLLSEDIKEGVAAFREKRTPHFQGR